MSSITHHCGPYQLTVWGSGTAVELRKGDYTLFWQGDYTLFWQGDEAADVADVFNEGGEEALDQLWGDYSDIATYEGTGPEED